jgi:hypothetical protein
MFMFHNSHNYPIFKTYQKKFSGLKYWKLEEKLNKILASKWNKDLKTSYNIPFINSQTSRYPCAL